jgi:hypothetical protein
MQCQMRVTDSANLFLSDTTRTRVFSPKCLPGSARPEVLIACKEHVSCLLMCYAGTSASIGVVSWCVRKELTVTKRYLERGLSI